MACASARPVRAIRDDEHELFGPGEHRGPSSPAGFASRMTASSAI